MIQLKDLKREMEFFYIRSLLFYFIYLFFLHGGVIHILFETLGFFWLGILGV